jgi:hypothetical protein
LSPQLRAAPGFEHAKEFVAEKWPHVSARHCKGIAESLSNVATALLADTAGAPPDAELRRAVYRWAFNAAAQRDEVPDEYAVDMTEFEKLEGCVTCLSVRLRG